MTWKVSMLGVRGSVPATGREFEKYGGDTLCVLVETPQETIFFDGGTGILKSKVLPENAHILIGHPHADHIFGLGLWKGFAKKDRNINFYMTPRNNEGCREILGRLYSLPLWPVSLDSFPAKTMFHNIKDSFYIGNIKIDTLDGNHPGGVTHFKISDGKRTVVYAIDCEFTENSEKELKKFAKDCDILFCDGMYRDKDFPNKKGWGHNIWRDAARFGKECDAKRTIIAHFDISETDEILDSIAGRLEKDYPRCELAKQGEVWII